MAQYWRECTTSASRATVVTATVIVTALLLFVGWLANILAYGSIEPLLVAILFFLAGMTLLHVTPLGGRFEIEMFVTVFSIGWFMAGIAAVYANCLGDPHQNFSDAASFFELSRGDSQGLGLEEIKVFTEGAGAVVLWRAIYDFFAAMGFEKGRYIGVLFNVFTVATAGVVAVKMARHLYGNDAVRLNRLILLFTFCGMFWLFAAIHLRDAVVMLSVTVIAFLWTRYLAKPEIRNLIFLGIGTGIAFAFFGFLRTEFLFVPFAMLIAGLTAISMFQKAYGIRKIIVPVVWIFVFLISGVLYMNFQEELTLFIMRGQEGYLELSEASASTDSLGMALIVKQGIPIRIALGSVYLFVFPIPFWIGFQFESAYNLFKSFNVLFLYLLIPLVALSIIRLFRFKTMRTPALMFNMFLILGFTMAIAGTSLETRHLGAFMVPIFLVVLLPDLGIRSERIAYKQVSLVFLSIVAAIHIAWVALKFH
jgi:hypothetical protein